MEASIDKLRKIRDLIAGERTSRLNGSNQIERSGSSEGVTNVESDASQPSRNADTNLAPAHRTLQSSDAESAVMVTIVELYCAEQEIAFRNKMKFKN